VARESRHRLEKELKNKKATHWVALKNLNALSATLAKYQLPLPTDTRMLQRRRSPDTGTHFTGLYGLQAFLGFPASPQAYLAAVGDLRRRRSRQQLKA